MNEKYDLSLKNLFEEKKNNEGLYFHSAKEKKEKNLLTTLKSVEKSKTKTEINLSSNIQT
jgi:hypothetical protein